MKILIVEDDPGFAQLLFEFLSDSGFEVALAPRGKEAIKAAGRVNPDLMLLDYQLGDMNGYDVAVTLGYMRNTASIPFLVISSMMTEPILIDSFKKLPACRGTFLKTASLEEILSEIKKVLKML
ncbi:MAG: hypothetical protein A3J79_11950 [Elusimicrobia bacterium RIFOXYB2_FULL_62_6]|nr:MAG: hypothetical protein A3J79_11950 [Elusimicrobia bacterium RIFOXYB2_FULL_62_6]